MDLTKILKVGDKVYSPMGGYGIVTTVENKTSQPIRVEWVDGNWSTFTKEGKYYTFSPECLLFPSENNRDWNTIPKFKNGDVIISECGNIAIFSHVGTIGDRNDVVFYHCLLPKIGSLKVKTDCGIGRVGNCSLASDKQKERIFKSLKANSYKWNDEIGIIEKIYSFKPFDKVLVRDICSGNWCADIFSHLDDDTFNCIGGTWRQCVPYNKETEHLVGTNQDCPDKYKIW